MPCSCIAKNYSVVIYSTDCKTLVYEDNSTWMLDKKFSGIPEKMEVTIETPSGHISTVTISPNKSNRLTSVDILGDKTPRCLEDGVYCFRVESCTIPYATNMAYTCNTQCKIDTLLAHAENDYQIKEADRLQRLLHSLQSASETGQTELANDLFELLNISLSNENCESC